MTSAAKEEMIPVLRSYPEMVTVLPRHSKRSPSRAATALFTAAARDEVATALRRRYFSHENFIMEASLWH